MAFSWLINGGDPNYLPSGMILQVVVCWVYITKNFQVPKMEGFLNLIIKAILGVGNFP